MDLLFGDLGSVLLELISLFSSDGELIFSTLGNLSGDMTTPFFGSAMMSTESRVVMLSFRSKSLRLRPPRFAGETLGDNRRNGEPGEFLAGGFCRRKDPGESLRGISEVLGRTNMCSCAFGASLAFGVGVGWLDIKHEHFGIHSTRQQLKIYMKNAESNN